MKKVKKPDRVSDEALKDEAAARFNAVDGRGYSDADVWAGLSHNQAFYLHQRAYIAGYRAAQRAERRRK